MKNFILLFVSFVFLVSIYAKNESLPTGEEVTGKGKSIVLNNGFTLPVDIWKPLVKELENNNESYKVTFAGFGEIKPIEFSWLSSVTESLKTYILAKYLENSANIRHGLGVAMATWLTAQNDLILSKNMHWCASCFWSMEECCVQIGKLHL